MYQLMLLNETSYTSNNIPVEATKNRVHFENFNEHDNKVD